MFLIECPYCGERDQREFTYGGEAHIARPERPEALSDAAWADYVFMRTNTKGLFAERWVHSAGCGKWFNALRDTASDRFLAVYRVGESPPEVDWEPLATPSGEPAIGSGNDATKVEPSEPSKPGEPGEPSGSSGSRKPRGGNVPGRGKSAGENSP